MQSEKNSLSVRPSRWTRPLMFADDIILVSNSQQGLQNCLNKLHGYCTKWKLKVNIMKSKIIVFNKAGRSSNLVFKYGNSVLDCVRNYKYLGIDFSVSGNFSDVKNTLCLKAMKSTFKLKKVVGSEQLSPKVALDLFMKTIVPIGIYGSEIWGVFGNMKDNCKLFDNLPFEKVLMNFGKYILGVNRKACNAGVRGELGLYPVYFDIISRAINYSHRLRQLPTNTLLKAAYLKSVDLDKSGVSTWTTGFKKLCNTVTDKNEEELYAMTKRDILDMCRKAYVKHWVSIIRKEDSKLNFYATIKNNMNFENYLNDIKSFRHRQAYTKLRISAHNLEVEKGRYCRPKIPRHLRFCKECEQKCEDECHFLTICTRYSKERVKLFSHINTECLNFSNLTDNDKTKYMLTAEGSIQCLVAKFCFTAFEEKSMCQ